MVEPNELPETWKAFSDGPLISPNLWTDAYLCAFAHAARLSLVTFDAKIPTREDVSAFCSAEAPDVGSSILHNEVDPHGHQRAGGIFRQASSLTPRHRRNLPLDQIAN